MAVRGWLCAVADPWWRVSLVNLADTEYVLATAVHPRPAVPLTEQSDDLGELFEDGPSGEVPDPRMRACLILEGHQLLGAPVPL